MRPHALVVGAEWQPRPRGASGSVFGTRGSVRSPGGFARPLLRGLRQCHGAGRPRPFVLAGPRPCSLAGCRAGATLSSQRPPQAPARASRFSKVIRRLDPCSGPDEPRLTSPAPGRGWPAPWPCPSGLKRVTVLLVSVHDDESRSCWRSRRRLTGLTHGGHLRGCQPHPVVSPGPRLGDTLPPLELCVCGAQPEWPGGGGTGSGGDSEAGDDGAALGSCTTPARRQLPWEGRGRHPCPQRLGTEQGHRWCGAGGPGGRSGGGRAVLRLSVQDPVLQG